MDPLNSSRCTMGNHRIGGAPVAGAARKRNPWRTSRHVHSGYHQWTYIPVFICGLW